MALGRLVRTVIIGRCTSFGFPLVYSYPDTSACGAEADCVIRIFFDFPGICSIMPVIMTTHEGLPIHVDIQGANHTFRDAGEMLRLSGVLEQTATTMLTIQMLTDETTEAVFTMRKSLAAEYPQSSAMDILARFQSDWGGQKVAGENPWVFSSTETVVLRYTRDDDVLTARFDMASSRVVSLNFSTNKIYGIKTLILPAEPTINTLQRVNEITGGKWRYRQTEQSGVPHIKGRTESGLVSEYTHHGDIIIPVMADRMRPFVRESAHLWVSVWGVGSEQA